MLKWLDAKAAVSQADAALADIERIVPKEALTAAGEARKKQVAKLDQTIERHRRLYATSGYNIYQKAKFANRVKWRLRDSGYPDDFINVLVKLLII